LHRFNIACGKGQVRLCGNSPYVPPRADPCPRSGFSHPGGKGIPICVTISSSLTRRVRCHYYFE
jgi:hypothetical protein